MSEAQHRHSTSSDIAIRSAQQSAQQEYDFLYDPSC
jgi:hypothetical protein